MLKQLSSCITIILLVLSFHAFALPNEKISEIRIPKPRASFDISHDYHVKLLKLALSAAHSTNNETYKIISTIPMVQGRAEAELAKGNLLDLYWLGAHTDRNNTLIPITVPTSKGLIGFRKFIIRSSAANQIAQITKADDLKQLTACQGSHWPDTDILKDAGYKVTTSPVFNQLFTMLSAGRCDYFPRGYHDADREVISLKNTITNIESSEKVFFYYPFAIYFYVNPNHKKLADTLRKGMETIAKNGELEQHMKTHPLTAHIYPLKKSSPGKIIQLHNPFMPQDSDLTNPNYFYQLSDFNLITIN